MQPLVVEPGDDVLTVVRRLETASCGHALLVRDEDGFGAGSPALLEVIALRFRTTPGLSAIALSPSDQPFAATLPLLGASALDGPLWPAALAVRVADVLAGARELSGAADTLVAIAERLHAAGMGLEWRAYPLVARPRPAMAHADARPPGVEGATLQRLTAPPPGLLPAHHRDGWVCLERIAKPDGRRRLAVAGGPIQSGEFRERSLCLIRDEPFPAAVELLASPDGRGDHPSAATPGAVTLGYLHDVGLPGGIHLSVFHDPGRGDDFIGLTEERFPGCHHSRPLGWALAFPSAVAPLPPRLPVDRVLLRQEHGDWSAEPATPSALAADDPHHRVVLHRGWAPDRIPLFRGRQAGRPRLTVDPLDDTFSDLRLLGYASRAPRSGLVQLCISPSGDVALARERGSSFAAGDALPAFVEPAPGASTAPRSRTPEGRPSTAPLRARLRTRVGALRRRVRGSGDGRVLIVAPWFSVGGGDNFLLALIKLLRSQGVPVSAVLTFDRGSSPVDNRAAFAPHLDHLICLPESRPEVSIGDGVAELVRDLDVRQLFLCGGAQLYPHLPALKASFPWVRIIDQLFNDAGHIAQNTAHETAIDLTVCAYRGLLDLLVDGQGRDPSRVALAYIGIDTHAFFPCTADERRAAKLALGLDPGREVWGYLGRISEEKCLHHMVEAASRLNGCHDAQFLIQGGGPARAEVDAVVATRGLDIAMRPFADDVGQALRALDVYVLPSRTEGIPLGIMEAMAAGVLPVATSVGGLPEVITPGVSGYLVSPGDPGAIAMGLLAAARTPGAVREEMAQAARARIVSEMSLEAMSRRYLEILTS
jgi:glycosyltransferase involved in cell wall biosynthesis